MKALNKGSASEFFKRKVKPEENIELMMNNIEKKTIAHFVGISESEIPRFLNFFEHVQKNKLPAPYKRHLNQDKTRLIYYNEQTGEQTYEHPLSNLIKIAFYQWYINDKSVYTFSDKERKLLPYVEERMIKQSFGLNSKRRDAEKVNLQRDQSGKMVLSKLARIAPDMKSLLSSRSYMLKLLVEKVYTRKEVWGKGKRANAYAAVLASEKKTLDPEGQQEEEQTEESLETYQKVFNQAKSHYLQAYGFLTYIPDEIKQSKPYLKSTPESMLRNIYLLNIDKNSLELYWFARLMESLPLPYSWQVRFGDGFDRYFYEPLNVTFDMHPSYLYILQIMNHFNSSVFPSLASVEQAYYTSMRLMKFYDFFEREYKVDMYGLVQREVKGQVKPNKAFQEEMGRSDWMAMEAVKMTQPSDRDLTVIEDFMSFWGDLNYKQEVYRPAVSPFGDVVWSSNITQKYVEFCPHQKALMEVLNKKKQNTPEIYDFDYKPEFLKSIEKSPQVIKKLEQERLNFIKHFLKHDPKPLSQPYTIPSEYAQSQFYNTVFTSPFNLEAGLIEDKEQIPLWLQKIHVQKQSNQFIAILNHNPNSFNEVKSKFSKKAIQMIRKHEPHRQQELIQMIQGINDPQKLKKLITQVNDIDAREQRKKMQDIGVVQEKDDSLGSSISQIDMNQKGSDSQEEESLSIFSKESSQQKQKQQQNVYVQSSESSKTEQEEIKSESQQRVITEQKKEPEKYNGTIFQIQNEVEKMKEEELNKKLQSLKKQKILKHKYSRKERKNLIRNIGEKNNQYQTKVKKNLITTNLKSMHGPHKVTPKKQLEIKRGNFTPIQVPDISEQFPIYRSEVSSYENQEVEEDIRKWKQRQLTVSQPSETSEQIEYPKKIVDDTRQTIQLQPIRQIKPDIKEDRHLKHIDEISNLNAFRKSFHQVTKIQKLKLSQLSDPKKSIANEFLSTKIKFNSKNNQDLIPTTVRGPKSLEKQKHLEQINYRTVSPVKKKNTFSRVCLGNTASSLLSTEPVIRRGDLLLIEAKKSLIDKGRGIETFMSKHY